MKRYVYTIILVALIGVGIVLADYLRIAGPIKNKLSADPRNEGIELSGHYLSYVWPDALVLNIDKTGDSHTQMDVLRCVLQASQVLKDKNFKEVILACRG